MSNNALPVSSSSLFSSYGSYPNELEEAFWANYQVSSVGISPHHLAELQFDKSKGSMDYITYLKPEDMLGSKVASSVMKFTDAWKRKGIAFLIEGFAEGTVKMHGEESAIKSVKTVVAIFERRPTQRSVWTFGSNDQNILAAAYSQHHIPQHTESFLVRCLTCPPWNLGNSGVLSWVQNILEGTDPLFKLSGAVRTSDGTVAQKRVARVEPLVLKESRLATSLLVGKVSSPVSQKPEPLSEPITAVQPLALNENPSPTPPLEAELLSSVNQEPEPLSEPITAVQPLALNENPSSTSLSEAGLLSPVSQEPEPLSEPIIAVQPPLLNGKPLDRPRPHFLQRVGSWFARGWASFWSAITCCFRRPIGSSVKTL